MAWQTTGVVTTAVSSGVEVRFTDDKGVTRKKVIGIGGGHSYKEGDHVTITKGPLGLGWDIVGASEDIHDSEVFRDAFWKKSP
jgi:hypothetical protein